ncbi:TetR/AcrR family transcriptional regulator [Amycolatopsis pithecellobii]|uniref:TetR family transcriptional regulator n=1 Tax=Amycolatopsis pithecellobii TaxID=664692 RepID=A0A6N7ZCD8_9PSEU|nr:TetR/AcrR family transcriptional regulator [Amycolatopsis pithecellobii]MTD59339.1 TetR family transcriptional regulator [Amycolatopsis pithecellobii]
MTADVEVRLRADARRNRDQIIAAAKVMFTEDGPEVPMEEIARRAGVGVGTLYRRFPDREALIRAVAQSNFADVLADAKAAETEEPTAWDAFVRLVGRSLALRLTLQFPLWSLGMWEAMRDDLEITRFRDEILAILDRIVVSAQQEGALRPDVGSGDVAVLVSLLLRRMPVPTDRVAMMTDRILALLFDGLRAQPGGLPGQPITPSDLGKD